MNWRDSGLALTLIVTKVDGSLFNNVLGDMEQDR